MFRTKLYDYRWLCKTALSLSIILQFTYIWKYSVVEAVELVKTNNTVPQPPPFSPSQEHLIHNILSPKPLKSRVSQITDNEPSRISQSDSSFLGGEIRNDVDYKVRNDQDNFQGNSKREFQLPARNAAGELTQSAVPSRPDEQTSAYGFDPTYESVENVCPPILAPGNLRWRKGIRHVTAALQHLVCRYLLTRSQCYSRI